MERRSFFKRLFVGVAAAPAIAQVIAEVEPKSKGLTFAMLKKARQEMEGPQFRYGTPQMWPDPETNRWRFVENGVVWGLDQRPLRFEA